MLIFNSNCGSEHGKARFEKPQDEGTDEKQVTSSTEVFNEKDVSILS